MQRKPGPRTRRKRTDAGSSFTISAGPPVTRVTGSGSCRRHRVVSSGQADTSRQVKSDTAGMIELASSVERGRPLTASGSFDCGLDRMKNYPHISRVEHARGGPLAQGIGIEVENLAHGPLPYPRHEPSP